MPKTVKNGSTTTTGKKSSFGKKKSRAPETAQEWLEEAISLEDSGDRWVQDPAKAHRFYLQALESYDRAMAGGEGASFDAEYNRARLFLQIGTSCALLATAQLQVVESAIVAHRAVVAKYPETSDVKYNLAMVLLFYVEVVTQHDNLASKQAEGTVESALKEALELLEQCRVSQTTELTRLDSEQDTTQQENVFSGGGGGGMEKNGSDMEAQEDTVDVEVSYISYDILFDTLSSMMQCYARLLESATPTEAPAVETTKALIASTVLPQLATVLPRCQGDDVSDRFEEAKAAIQLAELEFAYRLQHITLLEWQTGLEKLLGSREETFTPVLCANADACIALAAAMSSTDLPDAGTIWSVLTTGALPQITAAISQMQTLKKKCPSLFVTKGDIEVLRTTVQNDVARRNRPTLLKNATVYYKRAVADCLPKDIRIKNEALLKLAIVEAELAPEINQPVPEMTKEEASQIVSDARGDGLFAGSWRLLDK